MNWTGGSLQRTKLAHKGNLQQQKAYFAKPRARLQHAPNTPVAPFLPSWLRSPADSDPACGMPVIDELSVRHVDRSSRPRPQQTTSKGTAKLTESKRFQIEDPRGGRDYGTGSRLFRLNIDYSKRESREYDTKKRTNEEDPESRLLEANKRRLLGQQDWAGITAAKPTDLHFLSRKDREKVGKRRQVSRRRGALIRQKLEVGFMPRPCRPMKNDATINEDCHFATTYDDNNPVRVRIGTDALTNTFSIQTKDLVQSRAPSDPMLFEEPNSEIKRGDQLKPPLLVESHHQAQTRSPQETSSDTLDDSRLVEAGHHSSIGMEYTFASASLASEQGNASWAQLEPQLQCVNADGIGSGDSIECAQRFRSMHPIEGILSPWRFVSSNSNCSASANSCEAWQFGETEQSSRGPFVESSESARAHDAHTCSLISNSTPPPAASAIVDEQPWKSFLAISDGVSAHSDIDKQSINGALHHCPTAVNRSEIVTNWSQHATQGDPTPMSSTSMSAYLHSPIRGISLLVPTRPSLSNSQRATKPQSSRDKDVKLWRGFVFGSNRSSSSETMYRRAGGSVQGTPESFKRTASRFVPYCTAVSSVCSTSFRPTIERAPRMSEHTHDITAWPPPPGPCIGKGKGTSTNVLASVHEVGRSADDHDAAECTLPGEVSVTHASLLNNVSCDTSLTSSRTSGDTDLSPSHLSRFNWTGAATPTWSSTNRQITKWEVQRPASSIFPVLASESSSKELDLVNVDRVT